MSAWYVLSARGLYEAEPGSGSYWLGYPLFDEAEIKVPGGAFRIVTEGEGRGSHISKVFLNGNQLEDGWISYSDIMRGGELRLLMKD